MSDDVVLVDRQDRIATLAMNRPQAKNALNAPLRAALSAKLGALAEDPSVRVIVLTGAGGAFCSGADLKATLMENPDALNSLEPAIEGFHQIIRAIVAVPKPVIAMVDGPAVGFGCDLALACDLRVASTRAYFQEKFVKIGLMPDGGGTFWLPRLVGLGRAMELMLTGAAVDARRALEMGLVNRVVDVAQLQAETMTLARELANGPPLAFAEIKRAVHAGSMASVGAALENEKQGQMRCLRSQDCMEGVMAWMEKREPKFSGA